ncbi:uncharacterized protein LOC110449478 [Mizuhopecten yessoensis]|uniref:Transcription intermediary factor 1-beta n=1 Tax=Mizuhopecten yessoensis TaxID=6573 RepID=A0A210QR65_MIZYE|nr:uncharacterized protein LOC110449478 [Mizuhopecten yessoensis]OWF51214.1 Transcription intermediary factor 1-beta [Mizuhopecten yessoensis]
MADKNTVDENDMLSGNCEMCESEEEVKWYCIDCQERLCEKCRAHHLKNKKLQNDNIVSIRDARENVEVINQNDHNTCVRHGDKQLDFFCETCDDTICQDCLSENHRSHEWNTKERSIKSLKTALSDTIQNFNEKLAKYRDVEEKDRTMHEFIIKRLADCKQSINDVATMICEETMSLRNDYLHEINSIESKEKSRYESKHKKYSSETQELKTSIDDIEKEIRLNNIFHLHVLSKEMKTKSSDFQTPEEYRVLPPSFEKASFQKQKLVAMFGMLKTPEDINAFNDLSLNLKVTHLQTNVRKKIIALCPLDDGSAWLSYSSNGDDAEGTRHENKGRQLVLIDKSLHEKARSCQIDREVVNMALFKSKEILITCFMDTCIRKLSCNGKKLTNFADLSPNYARSVCVQEGGAEVIVCGNAPYSSGLVEKSKNVVLRLSAAGSILQEIRLDSHDPEVFQLPYRVTAFSTGEILVVDRAPDDHRVVCVDKRGRYMYTWRGEGVGDTDPLDITAIGNKKVCLIVDESYNKIYALSKDGCRAKVLLDKKRRAMGPRCIATDSQERVWVGCDNGLIVLGEIYLPYSSSDTAVMLKIYNHLILWS